MEGNLDPSQTSGRASRPVLDLRRITRPAPDLREGPPILRDGFSTPPKPPKRPPHPYRTSGRTSRPVPDLQAELPTHPGILGETFKPPPGPPEPPEGPSRSPERPPDPTWTSGMISRTSEMTCRTSGMASRPFPDRHERLPIRPEPPGGTSDQSRTSRRASPPIPDHQKGLPT